MKIKGVNYSILDKKLKQFIIDLFPINHLESLNENLEKYKLQTKLYTSKYVMSEGEGLTSQYFAIASALDLNKKIIRPIFFYLKNFLT